MRFNFPLRPVWAEIFVIVVGCIAVLGATHVVNSYPWPHKLAEQYALANGIAIPAGVEDKAGIAICMAADKIVRCADGLIYYTGYAVPVLITLAVGFAMTFISTRTLFGRYVYAIGGNPEAAELGGINTRRTIMGTFVLMGVLCAVSAAIQTARLNSAVTNLGVQNELDVISAAVIGGTSFAGGVGTIAGAVLGAVIMQSLRSGMALLAIDSPSQDIVVGVVLVTAVAIDSAVRLGRRRAVAMSLVVGLVLAAVVIQTGRP